MIDFHVHSCVSDGADSPAEIMRMARERKIKAVALTDHDSVEGIAEAELEAAKLEVNLLKGIEISVSYGQGRLLHIIGLGIDPGNEYFLKIYKKMKTARESGMERLLGILKKQGISINIEELRKYAVGKYLDRQALPKYFVDKKLCSSVPEGWRNFLDPIPYGEGELLKADEAINMIKESGGLSFLAHFHKKIGLDGYSREEAEGHIEYLLYLGLDGIERYYPTYGSSDIEFAEYLINKYRLVPSGGTDFHGSNRPEVSLGTGENNFFVPDNVYENIKEKLISNENIYK